MASDTFNGTNGTALATHDAAWANADASYVVANLTLDGSGNVQGGAWTFSGARYSTSTSDTSEAVVNAVTDANDPAPIGVCARSSGTATGYECVFTASAGTNWTTIALRKNGSLLASANGTWPHNTSHTLKIVASGTSPVALTAYVDGASQATYSDSTSPIASGSPGILVLGGGLAANNSFASWNDGAAAGLTPQDFEQHILGRGPTPWNPDRSFLAWSWQGPVAVVPVWGYEEIGPPFVRAAWIPERSALTRAGWTQALWAVDPKRPPENTFPASFTRPPWGPDRSMTAFPIRIAPIIVGGGSVQHVAPWWMKMNRHWWRR